jgi:hypothetical protein
MNRERFPCRCGSAGGCGPAVRVRFLASVVVSALLSTALLASGCASGKSAGRVSTEPERVYASHDRVPSWVSSMPEEKGYLYYVGSSGDADNFDEGKKQAIGDALSQVVGTIGIKATSTASYEERYFAEEYTTTIQSELLTEGKARLQDAEIGEVYYEQWNRADGTGFTRVWVLLKYSREEIEREQKRLAELTALKYGEVQRFESLAAEYAAQDRLIDAVSAHLNASISALKIEDGEVFFDRNIIRAGELLLKVRVRKIGEDQVGWVGAPLDQPLVLSLYFQEGDREVPVPHVPIRFAYRVPKTNTTGYKWTVSSALTDQEGRAAYRVAMVHEVSDTNRVDARVDLSSQMGQLRAAPAPYRESVEAFEDVLSRLRTSFIFQSDTRARAILTSAYFMQLDFNGDVIVKPVSAPALYDVLYGKRFSIRVLDLDPKALQGKTSAEIVDELDARSARGVQRILFGTVQIVEYDTLSGYEMARAVAEASLIDRETGQTIRTWQLQRSGTGNTREAARLNALTQVGSSLGEILSNTLP